MIPRYGAFLANALFAIAVPVIVASSNIEKSRKLEKPCGKLHDMATEAIKIHDCPDRKQFFMVDCHLIS